MMNRAFMSMASACWVLIGVLWMARDNIEKGAVCGLFSIAFALLAIARNES